MESILLTIKAGLDIEENYDGFDTQIILAINNAIFSLSQLGVGPDAGFLITTHENTWTELYDGDTNIEGVKSYILLRVKMEFDPPGTSFLIGAMKNQLEQLEWRLQVQLDPEV